MTLIHGQKYPGSGVLELQKCSSCTAALLFLTAHCWLAWCGALPLQIPSCFWLKKKKSQEEGRTNIIE